MHPISELDLEEVVHKNMQTAHNLRKELRVLEQANQDFLINCSDELVLEEKKDTEEKIIEDSEEEYLYYYSNLIKDFSNSNESTDKIKIIIENLPPIENKNYYNIINRIKLELYKEIYELEELKIDETDSEFMKELEKEQEAKKNIIEWIDYVINQKQEDIIEHNITTSNKLVFLKTNFGSIYLEEDLCGNGEYFESFKELLLSIENGTFKNVKQFANNNKLKSISEVKGFKTRIFFERLTADTYVILGAFIKKSDKAKDYISSLVSRIDYYRTMKSSLLLELNNPKYLDENQLIRDNIMNGLVNKKMIKTNRRGSDS